MKYIQIIIQILFLFVLFWIGEWIREIFHLMIPGSVIGLVLLFILLISGIVKEKYIRSGANFMMKHLVLFFVLATVGIMGYIDLFKGKGVFLIVITIVSTILVMAVSGFVSQKMQQQKVYQRGEKENARHIDCSNSYYWYYYCLFVCYISL